MMDIETCIKDIRSWMISNKLNINDDKTELLVISSSRSSVNKDITLTIGNAVISPSSSCRNLGVMFDEHATMDHQISNICRSTHFHLRNINSIRSLLTDKATTQLIHSLVTSRIDYCNSLLYGLPSNKLSKLQRVQNIACRIVCRTPRAAHITPLLREEHWLPVCQRIRYKILLLTYKAIHNTAPLYICNLVTLHKPNRNLRSAYNMELVPPKTKCVTFGDRSFQAAAAKEWNRLPFTIKMSES